MWFLKKIESHQVDDNFRRLWDAFEDSQHEFIDKIIYREDYGIIKDKDGNISFTDYLDTAFIKKESIPSLFSDLKKIMESKTI